MSRYIDADKLIAEIERRKKQDVTFRERSILIDIETAITSLQQEQPSLPSNLDEAAEAHRRKVFCGDPDYSQLLRETFKAGAEWMAGQGVTLEGRVCKDEYAAEAPFYYVETENSDDLPLVGNKVVVQIRKK